VVECGGIGKPVGKADELGHGERFFRGREFRFVVHPLEAADAFQERPSDVMHHRQRLKPIN